MNRIQAEMKARGSLAEAIRLLDPIELEALAALVDTYLTAGAAGRKEILLAAHQEADRQLAMSKRLAQRL